MALTDYKITETERDTLGITTANDQYINQAGIIKARFDALPKTIVNKYNQLIDALLTEFSTTSPNINTSINLLGDGTRKLNTRWSSNGAGDNVFLYITPNGETEKGIASISSVNGYLYNLRIKDPTAFVFSDDTLKTSAAGDNNNVNWGYFRAFKIPNAAVIEFAATAKSGTWISGSDYHIFKVPSGFIPSSAFKTSIELVQNDNAAILRNEVNIGADGWVYIVTQGGSAFTRMKGKIIIPASLLA